MSFLRYTGRQYTNQSREEQFLRYFRDSGASQALQKAMILLYKMPTKPSNLAEFFAEYLDNGARELLNLSLLKAELCYKRSETQNIHRKIKHLENQIKSYESQGYGQRGGGDGDAPEGDEHLVLEADTTNPIRYSMLDRFLVDLDDTPQSQGPSAVPSGTNFGSGLEDENEDDEVVDEFKDELQPVTSEEALRLKAQESITNWNNEIKKLDPWGIVCTTKALNARPSGEFDEGIFSTDQPENVKKTPVQQLPTDDEKQLMMSEVVSQGSGSDPEDKKYTESEDAETLAEVYYAYATAFDKFPKDEGIGTGKPPASIPIHHLYRTNQKIDANIPQDKEKDGKLLSVANPSKDDPNMKRLGDMMGWGKDFCRQPKEETPAPIKVKPIPINNNPSIFPRPDWSQFKEGYQADGDTGEENLPQSDPCLEDVDYYRDIKWQDDAPKPFPISAKDESFLLDYEMSRIAKKLDSSDDPGFMFEFYNQFQPDSKEKPIQDRGFCQNCQKWKMKQLSRAAGRIVESSVGTSTTGLGFDGGYFRNDTCKCGEDCVCICEDAPQSRKSRASKTPGKMKNWTKDDICRCEDCSCICEDAWASKTPTPGKMKNWTKDELSFRNVCSCGGEDCTCLFAEDSWPGKMANWTKDDCRCEDCSCSFEESPASRKMKLIYFDCRQAKTPGRMVNCTKDNPSFRKDDVCRCGEDCSCDCGDSPTPTPQERKRSWRDGASITGKTPEKRNSTKEAQKEETQEISK